MAKIGPFVTDPGAGAYCRITLDSGEKIMVNHPKGGFKGGPLSINQIKWMGFGSGETLFECDLDGEEGKAIMARIVSPSTPPDSAWATPLGAFVSYVRDCKSLADVKSRCAALRSNERRA